MKVLRFGSKPCSITSARTLSRSVPPLLDRPLETVLLDRLDRAVEGDPDHHPRVGEPAQRPADLPQPVVRLVPVPGQLLDQLALQRPGVVVLVEADVAGHLQGDHHLAEHVGLALQHRAVADAHRRGARRSPGRWSSVRSSRSRPPSTAYMIWRSCGSPAAARSSQLRHSRASSA